MVNWLKKLISSNLDRRDLRDILLVGSADMSGVGKKLGQFLAPYMTHDKNNFDISSLIQGIYSGIAIFEETEDWDADDYPHPHWAECRSTGAVMVLNSQLPTRDGRRVGNAIIRAIYVHKVLGKVADVVTESGNRMSLTEQEILQYYYPPTYIKRVGAPTNEN